MADGRRRISSAPPTTTTPPTRAAKTGPAASSSSPKLTGGSPTASRGSSTASTVGGGKTTSSTSSLGAPKPEEMTWDDVKDMETFLKFLKAKVFGEDNEISDSYNAWVRSNSNNENTFIQKIGGIGEATKKLKCRGDTDIEQVFGYVAKPTNFFSSKENKVLYSLQQAYKKNMSKMDELNNENNRMRENLDIYSPKGNDELMKTIDNQGVHLKGTRKKAKDLINDMRDNCKIFYCRTHKVNEGDFDNLKPEQKCMIFTDFYRHNIGSYTKEYGEAAAKLVRNVVKTNITEPVNKIRINCEMIDSAMRKNARIFDEASPICEKKNYKKEYNKLKKEMRENIDDFSLNAAEGRSKKREELKNMKEELNNKRKKSREQAKKIKDVFTSRKVASDRTLYRKEYKKRETSKSWQNQKKNTELYFLGNLNNDEIKKGLQAQQTMNSGRRKGTKVRDTNFMVGM